MKALKRGILDHLGLIIFLTLLATLVSTLIGLTYCEPFVEWAERFKEDGSYDVPVELVDKPNLVTLFPNSGLSNSEFRNGWTTKYYERITGYKVEYNQCTDGQDDRMQAILASKEEYHLVKLEAGTFLKNVSMKDADNKSKSFCDLKPALEVYGKNLYGENGVGGQIPKEAWDAVTDPDTGAIYAIPEVGFSGMIMHALIWNKEQLSAVGITKIPETITEINDALYALDAYFGASNPLYYSFAMASAQAYIAPLAAAWELPENFYVNENDEISHTMYHPQYNKYMSWVRKLYVDGLINPGWVSWGGADIVSYFSKGEIGCAYMNYWSINDIARKMATAKGISEEEALDNIGWTLFVKGDGNFGTVVQEEAKYVAYRTIGYYCAVPIHMAEYTPYVIDWMDKRITTEAFEGYRLGDEGVHFEYVDENDPKGIMVSLSVRDENGIALRDEKNEIIYENKYVKILPQYNIDILPSSMYQCGVNPKVGEELWILSEKTYNAWDVLVPLDSPNALGNAIAMAPYIEGWSVVDIESRSWVLTLEQKLLTDISDSTYNKRMSSLHSQWKSKWWTDEVNENVQKWHKSKSAKE